MKAETTTTPITKIFTEDQVMKFLDCNKNTLGMLRRTRKLPFIQISKTLRVYHEPTFVKWLEDNLVVLDRNVDLSDDTDDEKTDVKVDDNEEDYSWSEDGTEDEN